MALVLGVDSSTQSTKVEIRDADSGELVGIGRAPHPPTTPPRSEQDPHAWWEALSQATNAASDAAVHERGSDTVSVAAVSVAGQQHGLVPVDADGAVIRPAKLWNDTESAPDAAWLVEQLGGPAAWADACGSVPVAAFTITKLSWLHRCEPAAFERLGRLALPHDWLTWRLCERWVTDRGDASGTGYWSPREDRWRLDLLGIVDRREWAGAVPAVLGPTDVAGEAARLVPGAVVGPGTGDNMAAALGLGLRAGDVVLSIGTSGTAFAVRDEPANDPSGAVAGFADATGRFLPLVCTLNATRVTDAFRRLLGVSPAEFDALALAAPATADSPVLVPYLDGERTPNLPDATGSLSGLRSTVSREQVARAAIQGVVCSLLEGLDRLGAGQPGRVFLVGGGAGSAAYRQSVADLLGRPVIVPHEREAVAAGACVQAASVLLQRTPDAVAADWGLGAGDVVEPDPAIDRDAIRTRYREAAARLSQP